MVTSPDEIKSVQDYEKDLVAWTEKDTKVQHMIVTTLPNTIFICLVGKSSGHEYLTTLCFLFEKQSLVVSTEMHCQLGELKLKDGGDAHAHIDKIIALCKDLSSIVWAVSDKDLFNIIYVSLPRSYNPSLAALSSMMRLQSKTIMSDDLMDIVLEEYDRMTLQDGGKGKKASTSEDAVFGADASSKKGKCKGKKFGSDCYNCGWPGHKDQDCWKEGGGKAGQAPKGWKSRGKKAKDGKGKPSASANATITNKPDSCWLAISEPEPHTDTVDGVNALLVQKENTPELYDSSASQHLQYPLVASDSSILCLSHLNQSKERTMEGSMRSERETYPSSYRMGILSHGSF